MAELSISLVNVKQELLDDDMDEKNDIMKTVMNEHDYIIIKKEDMDNNNDDGDAMFGVEDDDEEEEEEELVNFEEDDADKIQAARTLAQLSVLPVTRPHEARLQLPDLRRTQDLEAGAGRGWGAGRGSAATSAASSTAPAATSPGTGRPTGHQTTARPGAATSATR